MCDLEALHLRYYGGYLNLGDDISDEVPCVPPRTDMYMYWLPCLQRMADEDLSYYIVSSREVKRTNLKNVFDMVYLAFG